MLFASILEALSLNPAIVVLPTHVIVGWETAPDSKQWRYLDTTKLDTRTFEEATQFGTTLAQVMEKQRTDTGNERWFYRWSLREAAWNLWRLPGRVGAFTPADQQSQGQGVPGSQVWQ